MAKARSTARDRAIAAFRKAMPAHEHNIRSYKVRSKQLIRVYGSTLTETACMVWSYQGDKLKRISV